MPGQVAADIGLPLGGVLTADSQGVSLLGGQET